MYTCTRFKIYPNYFLLVNTFFYTLIFENWFIWTNEYNHKDKNLKPHILLLFTSKIFYMHITSYMLYCLYYCKNENYITCKKQHCTNTFFKKEKQFIKNFCTTSNTWPHSYITKSTTPNAWPVIFTGFWRGKKTTQKHNAKAGHAVK